MPQKQCRDCQAVKSLEDFPRRADSPDGRGAHCNECNRRRAALWRVQNHERYLAGQQAYNDRTREQKRQRSRENYWRNGGVVRERERVRRMVLKDAAYTAYGGYRCACCGEAERSFLSIDHVNNDGHAHRKLIGNAKIYRWLRDNGYPEGFQVFCMNCQFGKRMNKGLCPHQRVT